jgi:prepilin-type N-terminal cleavage/methylation domain-containing protein
MKNTLTPFRRGLTMLELVFVIVILGIVASIASSIIVQVYESYIVQRALHRSSTKAELAATQIVNRLTYRISSSVIGKIKSTGEYLPIDQIPNDTYNILEWIAYDNDSFSAQSTPGWSGFCDVDANGTNPRIDISTPGSNLVDTNIIIGKLSNSTKNISNAAIIFAGHEYNSTKNYIANCMGFDDSTCISPISAASGTSITLTDDNPKVITDQYKLAWSAYAIVPTIVADPGARGLNGDIYDLTLHYNYQPWKGENYDNNSSSSTLVTNVVSFRFIGKGDTVRFKICVAESIGDANVTSCKEKAVIR